MIRHKLSAVLLILFLAGTLVYTQESSVKWNHEGKDFSQLKHTWRAKWITHPTESTLDYGVFLFRRSFRLDRKPDKYIIYVSADNRYRLYVNGEKVSMGPARGDLLNWRYETVDIAPFLKEGDNIIAAEVVNFGEYRHAAQQTNQTAFILQSDSVNRVILNTGDNQWKVVKNFAYDFIPITSDSVNGYYAAGPCDRIDASLHPWGWNESAFNDSEWLTPKSAFTEAAVGRDFLYGSSWFLVPRNIPSMEEKEVRLPKLIRSTGIEANDGFLAGEKDLIIPPNTRASLLIDQTWLTIGYPELLISGGKGSKIKITYAESLFEKVEGENPGQSEHFNTLLRKGNRNETSGKHIMGYHDLVFPDGGHNRLFRTLWYRTYRFVQLDIETADKELEINDFYGNFWAYPFEENASFEADDPMLSKIWEVAWRTQRLNSTETYADCPYYEQLQYIGDTRIQALITYYVSGDERLARNAIEQFDHSRIPEGLTLSRYPSYIYQVIPTFSLMWIGMVHDYYIYRNDPEFVGNFEQGIISVLAWFEKRAGANGLVGNLPWWNFTDWAPGFVNGVPPGAEYGYSASVSLQYAAALQYAEELFYSMGNRQMAARYGQMAGDVIKAVNRYCYDESRGMYAETPEKEIFSQHTNIFAILTDALENDEQKELMKKVLEEELIQSTVYFRFYLFRALQKTGMGDEYLNQIEPWKIMLDQGLTTFAEREYDMRSDSHAWSASPCFDLLHTVAGIAPAEPGFKSVVIEPNFGKLKQIKASMPHPEGNIAIDLQREGKTGISGSVELPDNLTGLFIWNETEIELRGGQQDISLPGR
ncbi:MAG: alpha-L-rhamnosidase N-terminal domain-containing protein [Bacteroidota bacterium]